MTYDEGRYVRRVALAAVCAGFALCLFLFAVGSVARRIEVRVEPSWALRPTLAGQAREETAR